MNICCPHCEHLVSADNEFIETIKCKNCDQVVDAASIINRFTPGETLSQESDEDWDIDEPEQGDLIGRFRILEKVGQGGFGAVYKAHDLELDRDVAIKLPRIDRMTLQHAQEFLREAQTAAKLRDPNIVSVYEIGRFRQFLYIVSDFVAGPALSQFLEDVKLSHHETAQLYAKMSRALHRAHESGVIHRDMKPGNVLMDAEAGPMITDFGLARRLDDDSEMGKERILGTPSFMSPEQALAKGSTADGRADVFSVGVMLYQTLTDSLPFKGKNARQVIEKVIEEDPKPLRELDSTIPRPLEAICLKALQKDPENRFQTAEEFAEDLERFYNNLPTRTLPENLLQTSSRITKRNWKPVSFGIAAVLVLAAVIGGWFSYQKWLDLKQRVIVSAEPEDARIAIIPLAPNGELDMGNAIYFEDGPRHYAKLVPGQYFFEVYHPEKGFQETYRTVPENSAEFAYPDFIKASSIARNNSIFPEFTQKELDEIMAAEPGDRGVMASDMVAKSKATRRIVLPPIEILKFDPKAHNAVLVKGGTFESGSDVMSSFPLREATVEPFYIQREEVTVGEYRKVMKKDPPARMARRFPNGVVPDDVPITYVSYYDALEYAERIGMRLPTLDEYLFVATNGGKTRYPWGNNRELIQDWKLDLKEPPPYDLTQAEGLEIRGLYSRCLEWTQTPGQHPKESETNPTKILSRPGMLVENPLDWRFVVGGGMYGLSNDEYKTDSARIELTFGPRGFHLLEMEGTDRPGLGFRCAKSAKPRMFDENGKRK